MLLTKPLQLLDINRSVVSNASFLTPFNCGWGGPPPQTTSREHLFSPPHHAPNSVFKARVSGVNSEEWCSPVQPCSTHRVPLYTSSTHHSSPRQSSSAPRITQALHCHRCQPITSQYHSHSPSVCGHLLAKHTQGHRLVTPVQPATSLKSSWFDGGWAVSEEHDSGWESTCWPADPPEGAHFPKLAIQLLTDGGK